MTRPTVTYRASRRNLAKAHKLAWSALERDGVSKGGQQRVMLPRWAWEMPVRKHGLGVIGEDEPGLVTRIVEVSARPYG